MTRGSKSSNFALAIGRTATEAAIPAAENNDKLRQDKPSRKASKEGTGEALSSARLQFHL